MGMGKPVPSPRIGSCSYLGATSEHVPRWFEPRMAQFTQFSCLKPPDLSHRAGPAVSVATALHPAEPSLPLIASICCSLFPSLPLSRPLSRSNPAEVCSVRCQVLSIPQSPLRTCSVSPLHPPSPTCLTLLPLGATSQITPVKSG